MRRLLLAAILFAASPAFAQQQAEKTVTLTVSEADLAVISEALNELPAKKVNPLFVKLQEQIKAQAAPPAKPSEDKK